MCVCPVFLRRLEIVTLAYLSRDLFPLKSHSEQLVRAPDPLLCLWRGSNQIWPVNYLNLLTVLRANCDIDVPPPAATERFVFPLQSSVEIRLCFVVQSSSLDGYLGSDPALWYSA